MNAQMISNMYSNFMHLNPNLPVHGSYIPMIKNDLIKISHEIESEEPFFSKELFRLKDILFMTNGFINQIAFGEILMILKCLNDKTVNPQKDMWANIHPHIERVSKLLFLDGHYVNAAEDAFIEINDRVKNLFHKLKPGEPVPDGRDMMNKVFADGDKAMVEVCDRSTETGRNVHEGTRFMLAGAMAALRNPKAHSNNVTITEEECVRRLMFASMLMYTIDEAVRHSGIDE